VPADRVFAYDHPHRPTTCYHDFAPSSVTAPFLSSHTGPSAWNRLPEDIRAEPDITNFRKLLETHYKRRIKNFNSAFNVQ